MASIMLRRFRLGISVVCAKVMFVLGLERFPNLTPRGVCLPHTHRYTLGICQKMS